MGASCRKRKKTGLQSLRPIIADRKIACTANAVDAPAEHRRRTWPHRRVEISQNIDATTLDVETKRPRGGIPLALFFRRFRARKPWYETASTHAAGVSLVPGDHALGIHAGRHLPALPRGHARIVGVRVSRLVTLAGAGTASRAGIETRPASRSANRRVPNSAPGIPAKYHRRNRARG